MTIIILIVSAVVYVVSGYLTWLYIKIAHSKNGIWQGIFSDEFDVVITLTPVINMIGIFLWLEESPRSKTKDKTKTKRNYNKFFKIKK